MATTFADKLYYKIGEVADIAGVRTSVLRFWESEFNFLKPVKSGSGQRLYSKEEVDLVLQVKILLYEEKYTIEGVKKRISPKGKLYKKEELLAGITASNHTEILKAVRNELITLRALL